MRNEPLADQLADYIEFRDEWGPISKEIQEMKAEIKRLRELLKQGISSFGEASEYALWLDEARAALEGKE